MQPKSKILFMRKITFLSLIVLASVQMATAQADYSWRKSADKSITFSSSIESNLIQFATLTQGKKDLNTITRYTYFFNIGTDINFKIDKNVKIFTGLNMKNIGLIHKVSDSQRVKHRVYTVGAPFGFKFHSNNNKVSFKTGVDVSVAFNYKWKSCLNDKKTKDNEFFSNRTSLFFPSLFAGLKVGGLSITGNYYLNNFFNKLHPAVLDMDGRIVTLGIGLNVEGKKLGKKMKKKSENTEM